MTEADLIEISRRFRRMEETAEMLAPFTGDTGELYEIFADLDSCLESCRDDMVAMQEQIRKGNG
jgi:hypothetical protein